MSTPLEDLRKRLYQGRVLPAREADVPVPLDNEPRRRLRRVVGMRGDNPFASRFRAYVLSHGWRQRELGDVTQYSPKWGGFHGPWFDLSSAVIAILRGDDGRSMLRHQGYLHG